MSIGQIDRKAFFAVIRKRFGALNRIQTDGLENLLASMEADPWLPDGDVGIQTAAYLLATAYHETGHTWTPVRERGGAAYFVRMYGPNTRRGKALGNDSDQEAIAYSGTGLVQTTGEGNFQRVEDLIRDEYPDVVARWEERTGKTFDLTVGDQPNDLHDPDNLLDPELAYVALSAGTRRGLYGPPLSRYINARGCNYVLARHSVNVQDRAALIAGYARDCEAALRAGLAVELEPNVIASAPPAIAPVPKEAALDATAAVQTPAAVADIQPAIEPVAGGTVTDEPVKANSASLVTKITSWGLQALKVGGIGTAIGTASAAITSVSGLSERAQLILVVLFAGLVVLAVLAAALYFIIGALAALWDHLQTKALRADPTKTNVK